MTMIIAVLGMELITDAGRQIAVVVGGDGEIQGLQRRTSCGRRWSAQLRQSSGRNHKQRGPAAHRHPVRRHGVRG
jgi:hypothetical protein